MIKITKINYDDVKVYKSLVGKESVSMANPDGAIWFGAYNEEKLLLGFNCLVIKKSSARLKSDYVFKEHRGLGIYNKMFQYREEYAKMKNIKSMSAFCTKMSIGTFMRYGFVPMSKNANGIIFVKK